MFGQITGHNRSAKTIEQLKTCVLDVANKCTQLRESNLKIFFL